MHVSTEAVDTDDNETRDKVNFYLEQSVKRILVTDVIIRWPGV
jgi:hypothetical protein